MIAPEVLHDGEDLLILAKPPGLLTTPLRTGDESLVGWAEARWRQRLHATSRLDRPVSGVVVLSRGPEATARLEAARGAGRYGRTYVALAAGVLSPPEGRWTWGIGKHRRDRRLRRAVDEGGLAAATRYRVDAVAAGAARVSLWPETGRTHQLRVHAARAGAPLLGDGRYGGPRRVTLRDGQVRGVPRVMLHCARVDVPGADGGIVVVEAPVPEDLQGLWEAIARSA